MSASRSQVRRAVGSILAIAAAAALVQLPTTSAYAVSRPLFQLPFPCGEAWRLATYRGHDDYDIDMTAASGASSGRPVVASAEGRITLASWDNGGGGWSVKVGHRNGWETVYLHLIERPMVSVGQAVARGQQLGRVGSTGGSTGPHLHFEQRLNGGKVESHFDGVPSGITTDGDPNTGPIYQPGNPSPAVLRTSNNCDYLRTKFADIDGDGLDEIVSVLGSGEVWAYRNRGNWAGGDVYAGSDSRKVASGFTNPAATFFADLTGDGRDEIITVLGSGAVHAYRNRGNWAGGDLYAGGDSRLVAEGFGDAMSTFFGDVDGDGRAEILASYDNGDVIAYRNRGWGAADIFAGWDRKLVAKGFTASHRTFFADIDGDGRDEIVPLLPDGKVIAYRNRGWDTADTYAGWEFREVATGFVSWTGTKFGNLTGNSGADSGRDEIVSVLGSGAVYAYRNRGNWSAGDIYTGSDHRMVAQGFGP